VLVLSILAPLVGALLLVDWPLPATAWVRVVEDFSHVPLFAAVTVALYAYWRFPLRGSAWRALWIAAASAIVIGALTELLQTTVGRNGSWGDFHHDLLGVGIALAAIAFVDARLGLTRLVRGVVAVGALLASTMAAQPVAEMYRAYAYRTAVFPNLAGFDDARALYWILARGVRRTLTPSGLDVEFGDGLYPGVSWFEPVPDWRAYRTLVLEVSNPNEQRLEITLRVHDQQHNVEYADRFNRAITLEPGERRVVRVELADIANAPTSRLLDLQRVSDVSVFRSGPAGPRKLRIHRLSLESPR
jgi:hypothetical protein